MGRKAKRAYNRKRSKHWVSSDEDLPSESGVDWLMRWNELDKKITQMIEESKKYGDYRFKWLDLSEILHPRSQKNINLKDPEEAYDLACRITHHINNFYEDFEGAIDLDEKLPEFRIEFQDLKRLNECYSDLSIPIVYQRICNNVCRYFIDQELQE